MAEAEEFRCFVGGLSWNTTDKGLEEEFRHFGNVLEAKVIIHYLVCFWLPATRVVIGVSPSCLID